MELSKGAISVYISFNIFLYVEDVDSKYMSIYKEEKNKKDCFEHLISLQDCDHRFHSNAECATREQDSKYKWNQRKKDVNIMKRLLRSLR